MKSWIQVYCEGVGDVRVLNGQESVGRVSYSLMAVLSSLPTAHSLELLAAYKDCSTLGFAAG